jgi:3alpha(or 20beta)-hydroxysteroid dehydrogenase
MQDTVPIDTGDISGRGLQDAVVIITGAARGQGAREAELFAAAGAHVIATDVRDDLGEQLAGSLGDASAYLHHDVTRPEDWRRVIDFASKSFGGVDVLVNNAGVYLPGTIADTTLETLMASINVNLVGVFLGIQSVIEAMKAAGSGSIVNISSGAGLEGIPGISAYSSTKWAVRGLTKCAAKELAGYGIRVNSVHPGLIDTPMLASNSAEQMEMYRAMIPLKCIGDTDDVAQVVLFLASPQAKYITGAEVAIDGGVSA